MKTNREGAKWSKGTRAPLAPLYRQRSGSRGNTLTLASHSEGCSICGSPLDDVNEYCARHSKALKIILGGYRAWSNAYGQLPADKYLLSLLSMSETGKAIKEVAAFLSKDPGRWLS